MSDGDILFVCADLIFTSKVTGVARELGRPIRVIRDVATAIESTNSATPLAILDLGNSANTNEIRAWRERLPSDAKLVAYGSHVDVETLKAARAAGCDPVLPRSEFVKRLVALMGGDAVEPA
jgi:hypothetical protein